MSETISFGDRNSGMQIANSYGPVTAQFHIPPDLSQTLPIVDEAAFDSYVHQHKDKCLPGTRTDIINQIKQWASSESSHAKCIFWLNGMAGTGKSTIARTMAESFSQAESLGASFFFGRGEGDRGNSRKLFPTIAMQLAINDANPTGSTPRAPRDRKKTMKEQFEKLIFQPLQTLELDWALESIISIQTRVIVLDALDECDGDDDIRLILQLLPQLERLTSLRLRVLLTSRPDLPVRLGFSKIASEDHKDLILHDIPEEVIEHDIALFLEHHLAEIRTERSLPTDWPGDEDFRKLIKISIPLFIFAATICRMLGDPLWDPRGSLSEVFAHQNDLSELDRTYLPVLDRLLHGQHGRQKSRLISEFQQVIGSIVILQSPLSILSLSKLLDLPAGLIQLRLNPLHSVIRVPSFEIMPIRLFHLSFRDFLLDPGTAEKTPFGVNETEAHHFMARQCLRICQTLRRNICDLPSVGTQRAEIHWGVHTRMSSELQYACQYWVYHFVRCTELESIIHHAFLFLRSHFLHWVEAMSIFGLASDVFRILSDFQILLSGNGLGFIDSGDLDFLHDAKRFMLKNHRIADQAPLQIYCAGLVFAPSTSIIRRQFEGELPPWICQLPQVEQEWGAELQVLEGHPEVVSSVAFSPDSRLFASGYEDGTVCLWEPTTGALIQTLRNSDHSHGLGNISLAFSPNSRLLATGSVNGAISLWNLATGTLIKTLEHTLVSTEDDNDWVKSVAFSPDGCLLASLSDDGILLWDPATSALLQILKGHSDRVQSVSFSPDGRLLASGSKDKMVRLWNPMTGALIKILKGHSDEILCVTFSPDSRLLAVGSEDWTIFIWDVAMGALLQTFQNGTSCLSLSFSPSGRLLASNAIKIWDLETGTAIRTLDHPDAVFSVAFSPDGFILASGSFDKTVRLWDPAVRTLMHRDSLSQIWSVVFSPDGRLLASRSNKGIGVWDPATGALIRVLTGHSVTWFESMCFSPDGQILASGSFNGEIYLWIPETGIYTRILQGHSTEKVWSVAFSPSGRLLASVSGDKTVYLWDPEGGQLLQILKGHSGDIKSVSFSPDNHFLASSDDMTVYIWSPATGVLLYTLAPDPGNPYFSYAHSSLFSCSGRLLLRDRNDETMCLWNPAMGSPVQPLGDHADDVLSTCFNDLHVHTDLETEYHCDFPASRSPHMSLDISIERQDGQWIKINGERKLWLPKEFRPSPSSLRTFKVYNNILAVGHQSGKVSFITFT
ncbi:NACHT and WD40 domain protein [Penicillium herquei]|nr:NACHT and WD40 domain protein [Penicillium herquei]